MQEFLNRHAEGILDILKTLGEIGIAQATYKTLKPGEVRANAVEETLRSVLGDNDGVKLSEGVLAQARREAS